MRYRQRGQHPVGALRLRHPQPVPDRGEHAVVRVHDGLGHAGGARRVGDRDGLVGVVPVGRGSVGRVAGAEALDRDHPRHADVVRRPAKRGGRRRRSARRRAAVLRNSAASSGWHLHVQQRRNRAEPDQREERQHDVRAVGRARPRPGRGGGRPARAASPRGPGRGRPVRAASAPARPGGRRRSRCRRSASARPARYPRATRVVSTLPAPSSWSAASSRPDARHAVAPSPGRPDQQRHRVIRVVPGCGEIGGDHQHLVRRAVADQQFRDRDAVGQRVAGRAGAHHRPGQAPARGHVPDDGVRVGLEEQQRRHPPPGARPPRQRRSAVVVSPRTLASTTPVSRRTGRCAP